ncbi:hypothetical protein ACLB2K_038086 [Fragaria x ananassa]
MSSKTATLMRWYAEKRTYDGVFRHLANSLAWKDFDSKHSSFSVNIRNVRLGLASNGFNPFRTMTIPHSTWPIILVPYNLPPTLLMKQPYIYLSVLIDGPHGPDDKIDVYLQPLIEELKELWEEGVLTFDTSNNQMFQLYAGLLWTINDFPTYANLSGWSTKEKNMCDNVLGTIMGAAGKTKDNLRSQRDLEAMGIRKQYHVKDREDGTKYFEPANFEMKNNGKDKFLLALSQSRMLDGSTSNIARRALGEGWLNVSEVESKDFSHVKFDTSDEMESVVTMFGKKRKVGRPRHMSEFLSPSGSTSNTMVPHHHSHPTRLFVHL